MSKKSILKMCQEIVEGKQIEESGFDCTGIYCVDCPIGRANNNGISCHDNTEENIIAAAKKYIKENTEFDWEEFKNGSIVVHCDTREKCEDFLKECDKQDIKWNENKKASDFIAICGEGVKENCYCCYNEKNILGYCDKSWYEIKGKKIVKWQIKGDKNMFKVGDKVKKINNESFSNGDFVVTVKKVDGCKIWFKETDSFLTSRLLELAEETTKKPNTELTFKEFVNEAEEGKIFVSKSGSEFYKENKKIIINLDKESQIIIIPDDAILTLKKKEYKFTEAIEKAREGNTIKSLVSREFYSPVEVKSGKAIFELKEIEGKWNVEE